MRLSRTPALVLLILLLLTSCAAPRGNPTPPSPTPTDNLLQLETLPTTTMEPTPTRVQAKTPKPWQTMTTAPTASPLPSLTPLPTTDATLTPTGIKIVKQKDGSTLVTDYDSKFQLTVPTGWAVALLESKAPVDVLRTLGKTVPNINRTNTFLNALSPKISVIGLNTSTTSTNQGYPILMRVATLADPGKSLMQLDIAAKSIRNSLEKAGYKVTKSSSKTYANGIKAVALDVTEEFQVRQDEKFVDLTVSGRVIVFQASGKLILISAAAPAKFSDTVITSLDKMVASITFLK